MADTNTEIIMEEVIVKEEVCETREDIEQIVGTQPFGSPAEAPFEPVKMKKPRAKAKAKPKEPTITKEDIVLAVLEATKKPVPDTIDKNKEMVTCDKCGLSITYHNLKYTHNRYCKALKLEKQEEASSSVVAQVPPPGLLQRTKTVTDDVDDSEALSEYIKNNPEILQNYLRNERANKANRQKINAKALLAGAF